MANIICPNCKNEIPDNSTFCQHCGFKLNDNKKINSEGQTSPTTDTSSVPIPKSKPKKRSGGFAISGFVLSLISIIFVFRVTGMAILLCLHGVIFSSIGLSKRRKCYGLAVAGLTISVIILVLSTIPTCLNSCANSSNNETNTTTKDSTIYVGDNFIVGSLFISFDEYISDFTEYEDSYGFKAPKEGYKYIKASFTYKNIASSGTKTEYASIYDFDCYADNVAIDQKFGLDDSDFMNTNLTPGHKISFSIYFEVPKDSKSIVLEYVEHNLFGANDIYTLKCE